MTDPADPVDVPAPVVVPYERFLECLERRRKGAAGLTHPDHPPTTGADVTPPAPNETVWKKQ